MSFLGVIWQKHTSLPNLHIYCFFTTILGNYSCLVAQFHMKRSISFHLIQSYLPSILIVAISWVSFWMDLDSVPGRISLGVITMLAVSGQAGVGNWYLKITNIVWINHLFCVDIISKAVLVLMLFESIYKILFYFVDENTFIVWNSRLLFMNVKYWQERYGKARKFLGKKII